MKRWWPMQARLFTGSGLALAVVLFFAVNVFSNAAFRSVRFDLTDQRLYTLSDGSRKILQALDEPITLRLYLSKKLATGLPGIRSYANRVVELLEEYEQAAGGKLRLRVIDPEPFSEAEDRAVGYGLKGIPLDKGNLQFYFGLVGTGATDEQELLPFFQQEREEFLEYDITRLIYQLANPKRTVVGLLSTLPMDGGPPPAFPQPRGDGAPLMIMKSIREAMEVRTLDTTVTEIPGDIDVLMLVHPRELSDSTLYAIDQFVLRGGRALVFVDPYSEAAPVPPDPRNPMGPPGARRSDPGKIFDAWGIELVKGKVVGDLPLAKKVNFRKQSRTFVADYPVWIDLAPRHLNAGDIVTAKLPSLTMASAGILRKKEGREITWSPLVETDDQAMQIDVARMMGPDIEGILRSYQPEGEPLALAARVTGTVRTAFPGGRPPSEDPEPQDSDAERATDASPAHPHLDESAEPIQVIVVADTDMLQDRFWVQVQNFLGQRIGIPTSANNSFVINALDNLTGSNDLISIRNRGSFSRPFTLVKATQQEADKLFRQKEQALRQRLQSTERKIQELQRTKEDKTTLILSDEQQAALNEFRQQLVATRKELRNVQHELRKNMENLEGMVKFINIGLIPLLIVGSGLVRSAYTVRRRLRGATR